VPADIGRLGVSERQVTLDVASDDLAAAGDSLAKTGAVWARVRGSAFASDGAGIAAELDASLAAQAEALAAQDSAALSDQARAGLEIVDQLARLYR